MSEYFDGWLEPLVDFMANAPQLAVALLAFNPVGELRVSIPVGVLVYDMSWAEALVWSLLGNLLVGPTALWLFPRLEWLLMKWSPTARLLTWLFTKTRDKHEARIERYQEMGVFAAIALSPLPGAGAWTAALLAHVFGLHWRKAVGPFYAGVVVACFTMVILVETGRWVF